MTLACHAFSRLRCCTGVSLSSTITKPMPCSSTADFTRSTTPLPTSVAGVSRRNGAVSASRTSRSIARASPTASSSLASRSRSSPRAPDAYGLSTAATVAGRTVSNAWRLRLSCPFWSISSIKSARCVGFVPVEQLHRRDRHDGRNRVLVDKLRMAVAAQQHREVVEPGDDPLQFDAVHQEDRDGRLVLAQVVQEDVLNVLCLFAHVLGLLLGGRLPEGRRFERRGTSTRSPSSIKYRGRSVQSNATRSLQLRTLRRGGCSSREPDNCSRP